MGIFSKNMPLSLEIFLTFVELKWLITRTKIVLEKKK